MRVITGEARGRILLGPKLGPKSDKIRPVLDKVKGAIFNILREQIEGARVLDLFAGTGSIGIEALSRGAAHATFVDEGREAIQLIYKNLERCGFADRAQVVQQRIQNDGVLTGGRRRNPKGSPAVSPPSPLQFDLIFVDPPYDQGLLNKTLRAIVKEKLLAPTGTIIIEHSPRELVTIEKGVTVTDQRKYGQTLISFLKP